MPMNKPEHHFLICASFRVSGDPKGVCNRKNSTNLLQYLEEEVNDRGLNALVTSCGCMKFCEQGPIMVHYPPNDWYCAVDENKIDTILDAIEEGDKAEEHLLF